MPPGASQRQNSRSTGSPGGEQGILFTVSPSSTRIAGEIEELEHDLKERISAQFPFGMKLLNQLLERQVLMVLVRAPSIADAARRAHGTSGRPRGLSVPPAC